MPTKTYTYKVLIPVSVGTKDLSKGADEVDKRLSRWERQALKAQQQFEKLSKAIEAAEKANENASRGGGRSGGSSRRWTDEERAVQKARTALDKYDNQLAKLAGRDSELRRLNKTLSQDGVAQKIDETTKALLRQKTAAVDDMRAVQNLEKTQARMLRERAANSNRRIEGATAAGQGLQSAGLTATAIATAPVVAGFYAAIKVGAEYERSMNIFQSVTSATVAEMEKADALAIKLGNDLSLPGVSAKDAAEAMTELGKAGMTAAEAMDAAKGTLQLATAAGISAGQAAEITANALNMFGLQASEAGRVADLLAGAANASSAEITDVAQSLQQAGAVFANAKVPIEDVVTLIGEMANQGIKGSDAGTSLKTMMQRLQSPTDNAAAAMKALNVEIYDQQGRMKPMREIIDQFSKATANLSQQQKDQALNTIFGADAVRAATIIFNQGAEGFDKMKEAVMRTNAAAELAAARTKGLGGAWEALKSQAETVGLIIYNRIKEPLTELVVFIAGFVQKATDAFVSLPAGAQQVVLAFTALVAAVGPVLTIVGTLVVALGSVASGLTALTGAATVGAALSAIAPVVVGIVVVFAQLIAGIGLVVASIYGLQKAWENGIGPLASVAVVAVAGIIAAFQPVIGIPVLVAGVLYTLYQIWKTNFGGLRDTAIQVWNGISDVTSKVLTEVYGFVQVTGAKIVDWWNNNYTLIRETTETVSNAVKGIVQSFLSAIQSFWTDHGSQIMAVVTTIWSGIKQAVGFAVDTILAVIKLTMQLVNQDWDGAWQTFLGILTNTAKKVMQLHVWMADLLKRGLLAIGEFIQNNWKEIMFGASVIVGQGVVWITQKFFEIPSILMRLIPQLITAGRNIAAAIWKGLKEGMTGDGDTSLMPKIENLADLKQSQDTRKVGSIADLRQQEDRRGITSLADLRRAGDTNTPAGALDKLNDTLKGLGTTTGKTADVTTKYNKALDDAGNKTKKVKKEVDDLQSAGLDDVLKAIRIATMAQESGGRKTIQNPRTKATGLFQVMPENIPKWTRNTPGVGEMSVEEFRKNADAQIKVFNKYMGIYLRKGMAQSGGNKEEAIRRAAAAWYGGEDDMKNFNANFGGKGNEPTFRQYTSKVLARTRRALGDKGGWQFDDSATVDTQKLLEEQSDKLTEQARRTKADEALRRLRIGGILPDSDVIQDIIRFRTEDVRKAGEVQPDGDDIRKALESQARFTGEAGGGIEITEQQKTILEQVRERFDLEEREGQMLLRQVTINDEVTAALEDQALARREGVVQAKIDYQVLLQRNVGEEITLGLLQQRNDQLRELGDVEINLGVLRRQNTDDQFVEQKRMLSAKREQYSLEKEISDLQDEIAVGGLNDNLRIQAAHLRDIADLRRREVDAVIAVNRAQLQLTKSMEVSNNQIRARVYDELARQKTLNESIADGIVSTYQKAAGFLDKILDKTIGKIPIIGEVAKAKGREILTNITRSLIDRFLPGSGLGDIVASTGNPVLDESKKQTEKLTKIEENTRGAIGNTVVNMINPNQVASTNPLGALMGILTGGNRGTSSPAGNVIPFGGNRGGGGGGAYNYFNGLNIPSLTNNSSPQALGGATRQSDLGIPLSIAQSLATGGANRGATRPRIAPTGKLFGMGGLFGKGGIFGDAGFGFNSGTISGIGALGGIAGGMIGGGFGSILSGAAGGIGMMSGLASILGMSSLGGPVGLAIGAAIGGVMAIGQLIFGKQKQRKADERTRNSAILNAFGAIDKLISDVNADRIDGGQAIEQAKDIRDQYEEAMSHLKDGKARRHAMADVSRITAKIGTLEAAAKAQEDRKKKLLNLAPTFKDGGAVSDFARKNFRNNPLGYIQGPGTSRSDSIRAWFPKAGTFADISNLEYVLDAETTKNVGVRALDRLRAGKGKNFSEIARTMKYVKEPRIKLAEGGAVAFNSVAGNAAPAGSTPAVAIQSRTQVIINQNSDGTTDSVEVEQYLDTPQGEQKIENVVEKIIYRNKKGGRIPVALNRVNNGQG